MSAHQNLNPIAKRLKDTGAVRFGDFTLSSGKKSDFYVDIKSAATNPETLKLIVKEIKQRLIEENIKFDKIACVELGGVPIAVSLSIDMEKPYAIFRKKKKDYGTKGDLIGEINTNEKVLVVEDVTTTGGSALSAIERVEDLEGIVSALISVVDRKEGAGELFSSRGIRFIPVLDKEELFEGI